MLFELWTGAVIAALMRGGGLQHVQNTRYQYPNLLIACLIGYLLLSIGRDVPLILQITPYVYNVMLFCFLIGLALNYWINGFILIITGLALNMIVIYANQGLMPVSLNGVNQAGLGHLQSVLLAGDGKHTLLTDSTNLWMLGDIFPLPRFYGARQVISIGDFILSVGVAHFLYRLLKPASLRKTPISITKENVL